MPSTTKGDFYMSKLSTILSIGLALAAVFSPILVAIINNRNATKIRLAEFKHLEEIKKMELFQRLEEAQFQKEYDAKNAAFSELIESATKFHSDTSNQTALESLYSSAYYSMSVCSTAACRRSISRFVEYMSLYNRNDKEEESFLFELSMLSNDLSKELFIKNNPFEIAKEK